mmetsp:Transcript_89291/g.249861  ORF Transcript_89291/g.249861 Transcript_89291/m.249861 type:complete len:229 (-) Transcript_89291:479-1165(-)
MAAVPSSAPRPCWAPSTAWRPSRSSWSSASRRAPTRCAAPPGRSRTSRASRTAASWWTRRDTSCPWRRCMASSTPSPMPSSTCCTGMFRTSSPSHCSPRPSRDFGTAPTRRRSATRRRTWRTSWRTPPRGASACCRSSTCRATPRAGARATQRSAHRRSASSRSTWPPTRRGASSRACWRRSPAEGAPSPGSPRGSGRTTSSTSAATRSTPRVGCRPRPSACGSRSTA